MFVDQITGNNLMDAQINCRQTGFGALDRIAGRFLSLIAHKNNFPGYISENCFSIFDASDGRMTGEIVLHNTYKYIQRDD